MFSMDFFMEDMIRQMVIDDKDENIDEAMKSPAKKQSKAILDHRRICKLRNIKNSNHDWVAVGVGVFFVAAVAGIAVYQNFQSNDDPNNSENAQPLPIQYQILNDFTEHSQVSYSSLPGDLSPNHYILYIHSCLSSMNYTGLVKIRIRCLRTTRKIVINSAHHKVHKIAIKTVNVTDIKDIQVEEYHYNKQSETLVLSLNQILIQSYDYDVYIGFIGNISTYETSGMYITNYKDESGNILPMLMSNFKPTFARRVFPCFDEPIYKATFQLILSHDKSLSAYSNAPANVVLPIEKTKSVETHFYNTSHMSTYHLNFIVAEYEKTKTISSQKIQTGISFPKGRNAEASLAARVAPVFVDYFLKFTSAIKRIELSSVTKVRDHVTETCGLVEVFEPALLFDAAKSTSSDVELVAHTVGQAAASQLFGCLVTTKSWLDEWLFTSLSIYMSHSAIPLVHPSWDIEAMFYESLVNEELTYDASSHSLPVAVKDSKKLIEAFNRNLKGAAILGMFASYIGEEKFNKSLQIFVKKFQFDNAGYADFISTVTKVTPQVDVDNFLENWINQPGFPLITVQPSNHSTQLVAEQIIFQYNNDSAVLVKKGKPWRVALPAKYSCLTDVQMHFMDSEKEQFEKVCSMDNNWYKFNFGSKGFYRVNYDSHNWKLLLNALVVNHTVFPVVDRANLLADVFELAYFNYLTIDTALEFTKYLSKEYHYVPQAIVSKQLERIAYIFSGTKIESCVQSYQKNLVQPVLEYLNGLRELDHEQKQLKALLVNVQLPLNKSLSVQFDNIFLKWLISSERDLVDGDMREVILRNGILHSSWFEFEALLGYYRKTVSVAERLLVLKTLSATPNEMLISQLVKSVDDGSIINPADKLKTLTYTCGNRLGQPHVWSYIQKNWRSIYNEASEENFEDTHILIRSCLSNVYTKEELMQVEDFTQTHNVGVFANCFNQMKERIHWNILFSQRIGEAMDWFQNADPQCLT